MSTFLKGIIAIFLIILVLHIFVSVYHLYWIYRWIDMPMHFLGGFWVAMIFFWLIEPRLQITNHPEAEQIRYGAGKLLITIILTVSFAVFIGVLWEFFEFLYDVFISTKGYTLFQIAQQGVSDTMSDLFFDLLGGFVFSSGYLFKKNNNYKSLK